jgi:hypothetical protein
VRGVEGRVSFNIIYRISGFLYGIPMVKNTRYRYDTIQWFINDKYSSMAFHLCKAPVPRIPILFHLPYAGSYALESVTSHTG